MPFEGNDPLEKRKVLMVIPLTEDGYCPFLNKDLTCNIYEDRPSVCQKYGTERHSTLRCPYQDKNGRTRSRQETRKILRDAAKGAEKLFQLPRLSGQ
jgi:Fe-S-cluster containining protein